jgi:hypothetical protein
VTFVKPGAILAAAAARSKAGVPIFKVGGWSDLTINVPRPSSAAAACEEQGRPQGAEEGRVKRKWKTRHEGHDCRLTLGY